MGRADRLKMLSELSASDLIGWMAYDRVEPLVPDIEEMYVRAVSLICAALGAKVDPMVLYLKPRRAARRPFPTADEIKKAIHKRRPVK